MHPAGRIKKGDPFDHPFFLFQAYLQSIHFCLPVLLTGIKNVPAGITLMDIVIHKRPQDSTGVPVNR